MNHSVRALVVALCVLATGLTACGGGGGDSAANLPPPMLPEPQPTPPRLQDSRVFPAPQESELPALDAQWSSTDRWVGVLDGAAYRIEVPRNWNGRLLVWARGYWNGPSLYIENPYFRRHLLEQGFAWAASSYTRNFYDVNAAIEDSNRLVRAFTSIAAARGRALAAPQRVFIAGWSMGGHVAAAAVEDEVRRDAMTPWRYDGALSLCGSVNDLAWFDYIAAYQLALQQLMGKPAEAYPSAVYTGERAALQQRVQSAALLDDTSDVDIAQLRALTEQLSGGSRPFFREGWMDSYHHNLLFGLLMNGSLQLDGVLSRNALDTRGVVYRFADSADASSQTFNARILRVVPKADANPLQLRGLRWVPKGAGQLAAPVLSMHTLGDLTVPLSAQQDFRQRVRSQGRDALLVHRLVRDSGHCSFTQAEVARALDDLVAWVEAGRVPGGDDVLDAAALRSPAAGCRFTDNRSTPGDRADVSYRARIQARYPACS